MTETEKEGFDADEEVDMERLADDIGEFYHSDACDECKKVRVHDILSMYCDSVPDGEKKKSACDALDADFDKSTSTDFEKRLEALPEEGEAADEIKLLKDAILKKRGGDT
ncbi:MAG: hypothetical protein M0R66_03890 [Candidatus Omnitrophica bacterium]|nr:hypothetical protein [Candidatus Omnitrophota bacterium]